MLDEGHKIKNPSAKCSKGVYSLEAHHRLVLTGTPVQNNLKVCCAGTANCCHFLLSKVTLV